MRILRLRDYYMPEIVASSHLSDDMDEAYMRNKIHCVNITPTPTRGITDNIYNEYRNIKYEELYNGYIIVKRFAMIREKSNIFQRAFRYLLCSIVQLYKGCCEKDIDVIFGGSTPPTQGFFCAILKKFYKIRRRNVPFVYNLQDVFPDSLVNAGITEKGSYIWRIGRIIENYTYKNADKIIVISNDIKRNIMQKGVDEEKIELIPNWTDTDIIYPIEKEKNNLYNEYNIDKKKFTVVYAGNIGKAQGSEIIIKVAKVLQDVQFVIFGGGSEYESFIKEVNNQGLKNIIVNGLLPFERVSEVYSIGDIALITCKPGTGIAGMPSKTWNIMACNKPIVASFDINSELSDIIYKSKAGICVEPGDVNALVDTILDLYNNQEKLEKLKNGRKFVVENASKKYCTDKVINILIKAYNDVYGE